VSRADDSGGGIGIDLVDVGRVASLLERLPAAEGRLFTEGERAYCHGFAAAGERFAARVAAKEAVGKALGTGIISWREIEVVGGGRPSVRLTGRTEEAARQLGIRHIDLSLTHTASQAAAVALALSGPRNTFLVSPPAPPAPPHGMPTPTAESRDSSVRGDA
jgi:holo-[acyl-carrier protein] synthase